MVARAIAIVVTTVETLVATRIATTTLAIATTLSTTKVAIVILARVLAMEHFLVKPSNRKLGGVPPLNPQAKNWAAFPPEAIKQKIGQHSPLKPSSRKHCAAFPP